MGGGWGGWGVGRDEGKNRKREEVSEKQVERRGGKEIGVKRVTRSRKKG